MGWTSGRQAFEDVEGSLSAPECALHREIPATASDSPEFLIPALYSNALS